ncbi:MAG: DUF1127 domain-containing protein [Methylorubrum rhodinum]|jgi:uncharacterized protein YjiS (DUF1127 family)|uniref:DUF1127 domain-containing protein n=1 Tax=Methylorubrum rhodinum TaxID=29428 RepID=UPI003BAF5E73
MFIKLTEGVLSYLRARETEAALADLSDAALDDIGLTRAEIGRRPVQPEAAFPAISLTGSLFALPFAPVAQAA